MQLAIVQVLPDAPRELVSELAWRYATCCITSLKHVYDFKNCPARSSSGLEQVQKIL
jgi:hypothetical protein